MLGQEEKDRLAGASSRKKYLRSVSWSDRSPSKPNCNPRPQANSKSRAFLPPLSIARPNVAEWPRAGSDDLGIWPHPQTPRPSVNPSENSKPEQSFQFKREKLAFFDKECSRIDDHIYLGSDAVAKNREVLRQHGITHVLNCVGFVCPEYFKIDLVYKTLWLQDSPSEDITSILYDVFDYFEDVRKQGGRVLVHCCQGVSRSTSLVIAYLMWREGQSFEDAFQYVKAARGVTNPNMGFACQLLQCQKRVHAAPASPNSMLRMYRMAPHSSYDPLHLVPKMVSNPGIRTLDSRGAFILHVPSAIYVWNGKNCSAVMSNNAKGAGFQVIRYESAKGPLLNIKEGEEPAEFWEALASGPFLADDGIKKEETWSPGSDKVAAEFPNGVGVRKVDEYDLDFELFHKALAGGVVPPFSVSNTGSETCLPARENGWSRLRRKLAIGIMKEFVTSSKLNCETSPSSHEPEQEQEQDQEQTISLVDPSSPSTPLSPDMITEAEHSDPLTHPCGSPDSFSCFPDNNLKFSSKSPTLSPSTSDYASSFSFSPSSSNWSDLSYFSSRQPSPSGLDSADPFPAKNASLSNIVCKETVPSAPEPFYTDHTWRTPCKGTSPSIAERRGMRLASVDESPQVKRNLVRSWSFSLTDMDDDEMKDSDSNSSSENEGCREEVMLDADTFDPRNELQNDIKDRKETSPGLYKLPSLNKIQGHSLQKLDSGSAYILLAHDILFFWLGRENLRDDHHWMTEGHKFLNHMELPLDTPMQVVREGEEPEQFLNQLKCLGLQVT